MKKISNDGIELIMLKTTHKDVNEARKFSETLFDKRLISYCHIYPCETMSRNSNDDVIRRDEYISDLITIKDNVLEIKKLLWNNPDSYLIPEDVHYSTIGEDKFVNKVYQDCSI